MSKQYHHKRSASRFWRKLNHVFGSLMSWLYFLPNLIERKKWISFIYSRIITSTIFRKSLCTIDLLEYFLKYTCQLSRFPPNFRNLLYLHSALNVSDSYLVFIQVFNIFLHFSNLSVIKHGMTLTMTFTVNVQSLYCNKFQRQDKWSKEKRIPKKNIPNVAKKKNCLGNLYECHEPSVRVNPEWLTLTVSQHFAWKRQ